LGWLPWFDDVRGGVMMTKRMVKLQWRLAKIFKNGVVSGEDGPKCSVPANFERDRPLSAGL
jgi:hypothetical protein